MERREKLGRGPQRSGENRVILLLVLRFLRIRRLRWSRCGRGLVLGLRMRCVGVVAAAVGKGMVRIVGRIVFWNDWVWMVGHGL